MRFTAGKIIVIFHFQAEVPAAEVPAAEVEGDSNFHAEVVSSDELWKSKILYICNEFENN